MIDKLSEAVGSVVCVLAGEDNPVIWNVEGTLVKIAGANDEYSVTVGEGDANVMFQRIHVSRMHQRGDGVWWIRLHE